jgi:GNAT superfamily N-acetyltransferase
MLSIRAASVEDVPLLFEMIRELADFEQSLDKLTTTPDDLERDGFGPKPRFRALVANWEGKPAGYALFFDCYSSWRGPQLFLDDLFVRSEFRGKGIATSLMSRVAKIAATENCRAVRCEVLDWNKPALNLYASVGAIFLNEYRIVLLKDDALSKLAARTDRDYMRSDPS